MVYDHGSLFYFRDIVKRMLVEGEDGYMKMKVRIQFVLGLRRFKGAGEMSIGKLKAQGVSVGERLRTLNHETQEQEIYNSCIILKNFAIVQKEIPMSTDYILEELIGNCSALRGIYSEILFRWRSGYGEESFNVLDQRLHTKAARNFAFILSKTEQINPVELVESMRVFEEAFEEDRMTRAIKRASKRSIITTSVATASIFAILMNFSIVVVFMDMLNMLGELKWRF